MATTQRCGDARVATRGIARRTFRLTVLAGTLLVAASSASALSLTGAFVFQTDSTGDAKADPVRFRTRGGDSIFALYLMDESSGLFINGPGYFDATINISLSAGTYTFLGFGDSAQLDPLFFGLNLFFNGDNFNPAISAFAAINSTEFSVNADDRTRPLSDSPYVPGAGTVVFADSEMTATLTEFEWNFPAGVDSVGSGSIGANGRDDWTGKFTLVVTEGGVIPEPSAMALVSLGLAGIALRRRMIAE
jgi:hypothetical protein